MVLDRFLAYVKLDTQSSEESSTTPTTEKQKVLVSLLVEDLKGLGLSDARMDEWGYVYASLPASVGCETLPTLGLIAHMDTSPAASGAGVQPTILSYTGGDIVLANGVVISPEEYPSLRHHVGKDLIVTDGNTLLGADDKAGVAEIVATVAHLIAHPEVKHPKIAIGFTPDEEVGSGADHFDVEGFGATYAYTVDGGAVGEIEYENFNAAGARITIHGVNIHPGGAKGIMKNAALIASELVMALPHDQRPVNTSGYEGFYHLCAMGGDETEATVALIIRDHDRTLFEEKKSFLISLVASLNGQYGEGTVVLDMKDSYYNMKEKILPCMFLIDRAKTAMELAGATPHVSPIRGGTDGARLSYMGLPCPNLSTGGENFHSVREYIPVSSLYQMVEVLTHLVTLFAD